MKILSLFDGMSVAQQAISELYKDYEYYASEIDEYAITTTQSNFPKTLQFGSVTGLKVRGDEFSMVDNYMVFNISLKTDIDLLIGGSPCQDLSIAKKDRKGLDGERSGLFYEYVRIRDEVKPKYFILENVASMSKESKDKISEILGVQPVMINASLVSAQNRKRLFWVGAYSPLDDKYYTVAIPQPEDRGIMLKDILEQNVDKSFTVGKDFKFGNSQGNKVYNTETKSRTLMALGGGGGAKTGLYAINKKEIILGEQALQVLKEGRTELGKQSRKEIREKTGKDSTYRSKDHKAYFGREGVKANCLTTGLGMEGTVVEDFQVRKLTPTECLRLQSMPDNYFDKAIYKGKPISNSQRYKMCGNAFNKEVIKHILKNLK